VKTSDFEPTYGFTSKAVDVIGKSCYTSLIAHTSFDWHHWQWPSMTFSSHFSSYWLMRSRPNDS